MASTNSESDQFSVGLPSINRCIGLKVISLGDSKIFKWSYIDLIAEKYCCHMIPHHC